MSMRSTVLGLTVLLASAAAPAVGAVTVFYDTFDSETVGTFPSTFDTTIAGPNVSIQVTDSDSVSPSNSVRLANPLNEFFETSRFFDHNNAANGTLQVADLEFLELGYSLNVLSLPNGATTGNAGFTTALGQGSPGGYANSFSAGHARYFSMGADTSHYVLYTGTAVGAANLNVGQWYDLLIRIEPDQAIPGSGTAEYFLDGASIGTMPYIGAPPTINGLRISTANGTGDPQNATFLLDNVFVNIPEPASLSLIAAAGGLMLLRRR
jgi:hypothetical protein